jgi:antitoxin component YwqK of YwqJK toxin-antitoxin module
MKIIITEEQKKKLFIPRKLSSDDSRYSDWNNSQLIKDGVRINQYDPEGRKTGYWEEYWDGSTKLYSKGKYKKGNQEGMWEYYENNGDLWIKGNFKNNKEDGVWEDYVNNKLKAKFLYDKGRLIQKIPITESEQPKKKLFIPRKLSGEDNRYTDWNNSQPIKDGKRINQYDNEGNKTGYWEEYWDNGDLERKGSYINGLMDGMWEIYYIDGELYSRGPYKDGERNGEWFYYNNYDGKLEYKTLYKNGDKIKNLRIDESEQPKKKLFIPRKIEDRYSNWNEQQPTITLDNHTFKLNQYDHNGNQIGIWLDNPEIINKNYIKTKPFMEELFNNLKVVKSPKIKSTNYKLNNKIIFQDRGNGVLTYFHNDFWKGFREKYNIFTYGNRDLIRVWMEIKYGLGHLYPNQVI